MLRAHKLLDSFHAPSRNATHLAHRRLLQTYPEISQRTFCKHSDRERASCLTCTRDVEDQDMRRCKLSVSSTSWPHAVAQKLHLENLNARSYLNRLSDPVKTAQWLGRSVAVKQVMVVWIVALRKVCEPCEIVRAIEKRRTSGKSTSPNISLLHLVRNPVNRGAS